MGCPRCGRRDDDGDLWDALHSLAGAALGLELSGGADPHGRSLRIPLHLLPAQPLAVMPCRGKPEQVAHPGSDAIAAATSACHPRCVKGMEASGTSRSLRHADGGGRP
jgi:hypothetical protein